MRKRVTPLYWLPSTSVRKMTNFTYPIHLFSWRRTQLRDKGVLPLDVVDNSASPLRTHFRLGFSSVDAPERVLHPVHQRSCPCFPFPQTASCSFTGRRLTSFILP